MGSALALSLALSAQVANAACGGDCDADGRVAVTELVTGVNIAQEARPLAACPTLDRNADSLVSIDELTAAVGNALGGCPPEPIFPADYRNTFFEVRDCRFSIEHGGASVRVFANQIAAGPYRDEENPLPVGSIVVKEEFAGPDCSDDDELTGWSAMRKETPGFDPEDGDWHWQWVQPDRSILSDDKSTCVGCHVKPDCLRRDRMCTHGDDPPRGPLDTVLDELPSALLSVSGTSPADVLVVGGDPNDGLGPLVLHYQGDHWERLATGASGDLWWVSVTPIDGDFYMAGDGGLILQYHPGDGTFVRHESPGNEILFGIWGSSASDLWAVGGDRSDEDRGGVIWHFDGSEWSVSDLAGVRPEGVPTLHKVWGRAADNIYAVGRAGVVVHFDGERWSPVPNGSVRPLFTVHGNASLTAASGGAFSGALVEEDGASFVDRSPAGLMQMNGVFVPPDGRAVAVGFEGGITLRKSDGWQIADSGLDTILDFHGTWIDPQGGVWAVGGDLADMTEGILAYGGKETIGTEVFVSTPGGHASLSRAR